MVHVGLTTYNMGHDVPIHNKGHVQAHVLHQLRRGSFHRPWSRTLSAPSVSEVAVEIDTPNQIRLVLLHPTKGYAIRDWTFGPSGLIRIGRGEANEVTIVDPQVSRLHAELQFVEDLWTLRSVGRNGTIVDGKALEVMTLGSSGAFQLGPGGPTLEFRRVPDEKRTVENPPAEPATTFSPVIDLEAALAIDVSGRDQELERIVETPFFQRLQQNAAGLREKRKRHLETDD